MLRHLHLDQLVEAEVEAVEGMVEQGLAKDLGRG